MTTHAGCRDWRSWPWHLIVLLCECLTSIGIGTDQAVIKRTVLFGMETSSEKILAYARDPHMSDNEQQSIQTNTSSQRSCESYVCLMNMVHCRTMNKHVEQGKKNDDQSWRIRYIGLLCMSQVYKHLQSESRHRTLSNLVWMFIHEFEKFERDDRVLEALKVGRVMFERTKSY
jgi:hypothetical protein